MNAKTLNSLQILITGFSVDIAGSNEKINAFDAEIASLEAQKAVEIAKIQSTNDLAFCLISLRDGVIDDDNVGSSKDDFILSAEFVPSVVSSSFPNY